MVTPSYAFQKYKNTFLNKKLGSVDPPPRNELCSSTVFASNNDILTCIVISRFIKLPFPTTFSYCSLLPVYVLFALDKSPRTTKPLPSYYGTIKLAPNPYSETLLPGIRDVLTRKNDTALFICLWNSSDMLAARGNGFIKRGRSSRGRRGSNNVLRSSDVFFKITPPKCEKFVKIISDLISRSRK